MLLLGNVVLVLVLAFLIVQAVFFSRLTRRKDELDWRAYQATSTPERSERCTNSPMACISVRGGPASRNDSA